MRTVSYQRNARLVSQKIRDVHVRALGDIIRVYFWNYLSELNISTGQSIEIQDVKLQQNAVRKVPELSANVHDSLLVSGKHNNLQDLDLLV